jgi:hypothetical protein
VRWVRYGVRRARLNNAACRAGGCWVLHALPRTKRVLQPSNASRRSRHVARMAESPSSLRVRCITCSSAAAGKRENSQIPSTPASMFGSSVRCPAGHVWKHACRHFGYFLLVHVQTRVHACMCACRACWAVQMSRTIMHASQLSRRC